MGATEEAHKANVLLTLSLSSHQSNAFFFLRGWGSYGEDGSSGKVHLRFTFLSPCETLQPGLEGQ